MNSVILLTILGLALPIYGQETQIEKKQDKRGILGLGYSGLGYDGLGLHGNLGTGYTGYRRGYLGITPASSLSHAISGSAYSAGYGSPILSHGYSSPLYGLSYSGGLGYGNLGYGIGLGHGLGAGYFDYGHAW